MTFLDDLLSTSGLDVLRASNGATGVHNPYGGSSSGTLSIILSNRRVEPVQDERGKTHHVDVGELQADPADLTAIDLRDTWTVASQTWAVRDVIQRAPIYVATVVRDTRIRYGGSNYKQE